MITSLPNRPYLITVPATSLIVALGSTGLFLGVAGIIGGAALGLAWSTVLGLIVERLIRRPSSARPGMVVAKRGVCEKIQG